MRKVWTRHIPKKCQVIYRSTKDNKDDYKVRLLIYKTSRIEYVVILSNIRKSTNDAYYIFQYDIAFYKVSRSAYGSTWAIICILANVDRDAHSIIGRSAKQYGRAPYLGISIL